MKTLTNGLTGEELLRLNAAYVAIREPAIRAEFLRTLEDWARDQWFEVDG